MGDATSAIKAANETIAATQKVERQVDTTTRHVSKQVEDTRFRIGGSIRQFGENALQALAAIGIKRWVEGAIHEWGQAEAATMRLTAAMESNGHASEALSADYEKFATDMEKITTLNDDAVTGMLATAESMGFTGKAAERVTKLAVSLSGALKGSADAAPQYTRIGAMIEQGNLKPLQRMFPVLRGITDQTELAAKAQKLLEGGFAAAKAETSGHVGSMKQLKNAYSNFLEEIGKVAAAGLKPLIDLLGQTVEWLRSLSDTAKQNIVTFAGIAAALLAIDPLLTLLGSLLSPVVITLGLLAAGLTVVAQQMGGFEVLWGKVKSWGLDAWDVITARTQEFVEWATPYVKAYFDALFAWWQLLAEQAVIAWDKIKAYAIPILEGVKNALIEAFVLMEFTFRNFGDSAELEWLRFERGLLRIAIRVRDIFTVDIPAAFTYLAQNWEKMALAIEDFTLKVFQDIYESVRDVVINIGKSLWNWIRGAAGEDVVTGVIQRSIEVAAEGFTKGGWLDEAEASISKDIDKLGGDLDKKFEQFRDDRLRALGVIGADVGGGGTFGEQFEEALAGGDFGGGGDFGENLADKLKIPVKSVPTPKRGKAQQDKFDVAAFGSLEAFSRISSFSDLVAGKTGDPLTSIDEKMTKQNELLQGIKDNQDDGVDLGGGDF